MGILRTLKGAGSVLEDEGRAEVADESLVPKTEESVEGCEDSVLSDVEDHDGPFGDSWMPKKGIEPAKPTKSAPSVSGHSEGDSSGLPDIKAPPNTAAEAIRVAQLAAKITKSNPHNLQSLCVICVVKKKVGKQKYCQSCRNKVEAAEAHAVEMDKKRDDETTPNKDKIEELKSAADPTMLRLTVIDFEAKTNPQGLSGKTSKKFRKDYDFCNYNESWQSSTNVDDIAKVKPLTKFQFFKHFQDEEGKTTIECQTKWNEMLSLALPEDMKDGEVRIRVCVDEYALHRNSKSRINEVRASLKEMKNPKAETIQALKENLDVRQEGFNHKFFHEVGGGDKVNQIVGLPQALFQKDAQMSVGGGKAPAEPTKKRPNEEDDGPTAPASKKLKDSNSILNKLRLKLIDILAEIEKSSQLVLAQESDMMKVVPVEGAAKV